MTVDAEAADPFRPVVVFSPLAWLKLQYMCHAGDSEVGGFGVARDPEHPLYIDDFYTVPQEAGWASVEFDDVGVADFAEDRVAEGLKPHQFLRVWIHTHPGDSPHPSGTDEDTFRRRFGDCDWAVMFILAKGGDVYARLKFNSANGPAAAIMAGVSVDWGRWTGQADERRTEVAGTLEGWKAEYDKNVTVRVPARPANSWLKGDWPRGGPVEIRADTSRLNLREPGFSAFGAPDDGDEDPAEAEAESLQAYLNDQGLDFEDLFRMRDEDLDYHGFTPEDVRRINAGQRLDGMTDADYRLFRAEWEFWHEDEAPAAEEDDDAPKKQFRNPRGPRKRGRARR